MKQTLTLFSIAVTLLAGRCAGGAATSAGTSNVPGAGQVVVKQVNGAPNICFYAAKDSYQATWFIANKKGGSSISNVPYYFGDSCTDATSTPAMHQAYTDFLDPKLAAGKYYVDVNDHYYPIPAFSFGGGGGK
ncbi:uncharacterized protein PFL1_00888 [Pseudozyma flocculosa PF-1]|uniref:Uncharacterized protein n=1 Tax=Pseudozyma flocculosa TaxID=84751 RepID=A0A5C3F2E4_9BASI|nr:uncharacterized protein PFL1_00888 [Pseudozyma flocculosa PF-1]EPQ31555.1 hypothetical protein PFL1_00888 [Pseudozyma flocculosa PF-1]SPO38654.1 uncharacterized protein PSFLO_04133 [Pseudozyma flocculosa]